MRSIRCTVATNYLRLCAECKVLKKDPPPNPLNHLDLSTARRYYADKLADDDHDARDRLLASGVSLE